MTQHPEGSPAGWEARPQQYGQPENVPSYEQPAQPGQAGPNQYGQPGPANQYGQPGQPSAYGQSDGAAQYGQPGQSGPYGHPNQPGQPQQGWGQPGYSQQQQQPWASQPPGQQQPWAPQQGQPPHGQPPYGQAPYGQGVAPLSQSDERLWGTLAHISIPFIGFVGPLIAYLVFKDRSPWLKATSTEALNFSILYTILQFVCTLLITVGIGAILFPLVLVAGLVLCILAAIAANKGEQYKYPVNWRLIK